MGSYTVQGVFLVIFSVLTALTNLILITTILRTRQLHLSSKYIIVLILCTCDLITGLFQYSISADLILGDDHTYFISDCNLQMALTIYVPYILATLRMSLMMALLIEFALGLMIGDVKLLFKMSLIMIACSIVVSFVLIFSMVPPEQNRCTPAYGNVRALFVSTYFPQMVVLVFLGVTIMYVYSKHRTQLPNFDPANPPASPSDIIIAAAIMVLFAFPQNIYLVAPISTKCSLGGSECGIDMEALFYCMQFFNYSQTFVIPLVWFANHKIRIHVGGCRCLCPSRNEGFTDVELNHNTSSTHLR